MKKKLFLSLSTLLFSLVGVTSCETNISSSSSSSASQSSIDVSEESSSSNLSSSEVESSNSESSYANIGEKHNALSVEEAIALCDKEDGNNYFVYGFIKSIDNPTYGQMTITDGTNSLSVYGTTDENGNFYNTLETKPVAGDEIVLKGKLKMYNSSPEMDRSVIVEFVHHEPVIDDSYVEKTILEARESESGSKVKLTGVVAKITYAFGMAPNGFVLVDGTSSIYVYGSQVAPQVNIGNTVTIVGEKVLYINPDESNNANKFNYCGAVQIQNPTLLSNDNGNSSFETSWIEKTTVKELMDKDPSEEFTSKIYEVNALLKKVPGNGFTNYYINDLDGTTGSYIYTMCNGNDFGYLDEYDNKLVTMYMTVLNAKSTNSGCVYRLLPISIISDDYKFNLDNSAEFAVKYYGLTQFFDKYVGEISKEVITSVSSELLGFENVTLEYSSSNEEVIAFETVEDKLFMNSKGAGEATISIKGTYGSKTYTGTMKITIEIPQQFDSVTVKEAIDAEVDTKPIVKGIVGPSLVNKTGFYLIDESGAIAVLTDAESMKTVSIGNEVVLTGTRVQYHTIEGSSYAGQTCLRDCEILTNNYGKVDYSTASFDSSKTIDDLLSMVSLTAEDYTQQVYTLQAKITKVESTYFSNYYIGNDSDKITLYSASGASYSWLNPFVNQTVDIEVALCNWNDKKDYKATVLSVTSNGQKVFNELNFAK